MSEQKAYHDMSDSEKKKEDWMNNKWRPMMGWMYMVVCICDFVLFPVLWSLVHTVMKTGMYTQWQPLTLQGAGLFHIAMGAVLGLAAWGRTQEKLGGANNGGLAAPGGFGAPSGFGVPSGMSSSGGFGTPAPMAPRSTTVTTTYGATPSFSAPGASPRSGVMMSSTGKPMPIQPDEEEL